VAEAELAEQVGALLGVAADKAPAAIDALLDTGEALAATGASRPTAAAGAGAPGGHAGEADGRSRWRRAHAEQGLGRSRRWPHRPDQPRTFAGVDWEIVFGWLAERHGLTLAPEQAEAVRAALTQPVSILTGGPGTGKTHCLRAVLTLARGKRLRPLLAAPTGRAAKRMAEATGQPAATLHRLLGLKPGGAAEYGAENPLPADLVVVDEVSMLDALLANALVRAVAPGAHLLLVGDADQLPSVGAGAVLADLIAAGRFPVTRLTRIFRQAEGSGIAVNARRINAGEPPGFFPAGGVPARLRDPAISDCVFLPADEPPGG
jgi:exodeoxyribonuclease V alpha subunit